ncbi:MAG: DUF1579 family protein [Balneolaceae bacterium]|nr:DUF1579 family protein [Balneolaceae bacterium]
MRLESHILFLVLFVVNFSSCTPKEDTAGKPATTVDYTDRPGFTEIQSPGDGHEILNNLEGSWYKSGSGYLPSASGPTPTAGTAKGQWILKGNFFEWREESWPITDSTRVSESIYHFGYDNLRQMYVLWIMSTESVMTQYLIGKSEAENQLTFRRTSIISYKRKEIAFHVRLVINFSDENSLIMEYFEQWDALEVNNGKEFQLWRNEFTKN